jgi:hypothetical protein
VVETGETGVLATIAFLVVFRVLIRDFFWMVTLVSFDVVEDVNSWNGVPYSTSHAKLGAVLVDVSCYSRRRI